MKKLCCLIVLAVATLIGVAAVVPAPAQAAATAGHREFIEFVLGPFERERWANEKAHELRERGFHTEVFYVEHGGWNVKAWKH